jgi:Leucine-rich repeat (LRR) protein
MLIRIMGLMGSSVSSKEVEALFFMYTSLDGDNWQWRNESLFGPKWNFTDPIDESDPCGGPAGPWQGVVCNSMLAIPCSEGNVSHCNIAGLELIKFGLKGQFPDATCDLIHLKSMELSRNNISGHLPSCVDKMNSLTSWSMKANAISGSIPSSFYSLTSLHIFIMSNNKLDGSILPEIGRLSHLNILDLGYNTLTGSIPLEMFDLIELRDLSLFFNFITGSFPSSIGKMTNLFMLDVDGNLMTGTIPPEVGSLGSLNYLPWGRNHFTGTIPPELGNLHNLYYFGFGHSRLTGTIPSELFQGNLSFLQDVNLVDNHLSGFIPSTIADLKSLQYIQLLDNKLSGNLPTEMGKMTQLVVLQFQNNKLTGKLSNMLWQASNMSMINLDLSGNNLSGDIPNELFQLPNVETISLSTNCFHGTLPDHICYARNLSVISFNSLSASSGCKTAYSLPGSKVLLNKAVGGTIPECVFQLPLIEIVHMSGNGFYGSIGDLPQSSKLNDFSLAHNQLTGTIPISIQHYPMVRMDLSYNRFTGDCSHFATNYTKLFRCPANSPDCSAFEGITKKLNLEVNRLSGGIPNHIAKGGRKINILTGNMFSCQYLPSKDPSFGQYTCGSSALNYSCYALIALIGTYLGVLGLFYWLWKTPDDGPGTGSESEHASIAAYMKKWGHDTSSNISLYCGFLNYRWKSKMPNVWHFNDTLSKIVRGSSIIVTLGFVCCLPVYALQVAEYGSDDGKYTTHKHSYWWVMSAMNTKGVLPALVFLFAWFCCMCVLIVDYGCRVLNQHARYHDNKDPQQQQRQRQQGATNTEPLNVKIKLWRKSEINHGGHDEEDIYVYIVLDWATYIICLAIVNSVVVIGANGLFLYCVRLHLSVTRQRLVELCFALFVNVWNLGLVPGFVFKPGVDMRHRVMIKTFISLFNSVVVPCFVTTLSDPDCFRVGDAFLH